jgi:hypothetical protein
MPFTYLDSFKGSGIVCTGVPCKVNSSYHIGQIYDLHTVKHVLLAESDWKTAILLHQLNSKWVINFRMDILGPIPCLNTISDDTVRQSVR